MGGKWWYTFLPVGHVPRGLTATSFAPRQEASPAGATVFYRPIKRTTTATMMPATTATSTSRKKCFIGITSFRKPCPRSGPYTYPMRKTIEACSKQPQGNGNDKEREPMYFGSRFAFLHYFRLDLTGGHFDEKRKALSDQIETNSIQRLA